MRWRFDIKFQEESDFKSLDNNRDESSMSLKRFEIAIGLKRFEIAIDLKRFDIAIDLKRLKSLLAQPQRFYIAFLKPFS